MANVEQATEKSSVQEVPTQAVAEQLDRMLDDPLFRNGKRYAPFLRYVVEKTLSGMGDQLKERTLGIEVFKRPADYDSNSDPVVRVIAGEVRKRIAQYYVQSGHQHEIRIEIPLGTYIPNFRMPEQEVPHTRITMPGALVEQPILTGSDRPWWRTKLLFGAVSLVSATVSVLWYAIGSTSTPLKKFWAPITSAEGTTLVCVSVQDDYPPSARPAALANEKPELLSYQKDRWVNRLGLADATALAQMAGVLYSRGKDYQVAGAQSVGLNQLRHGPVVLIGAFNNDWTLRMTRDLRFGFSNDQTTGQHWIVDRVRHNRLDLEINSKTPYKNIVVDYGLVSRFNDPVCGCTVVIAAGLGEYGTIAAGEFLSHDEYFKQILGRAPRRWEKMNIFPHRGGR